MSLSLSLSAGDLPGTCRATAVVEDTEDAEVSLEVTAYSSASTEKGEGCLLDIDLSVMGEQREGEAGHHWTRLSISLNKAQARVLRDLINTFLAMD